MRATNDGPPLRLHQCLSQLSPSDLAAVARSWAAPQWVAGSPADLARAILTPEAVARVLAQLGDEARDALALVQSYGGRAPAAVLERSYGRVAAARGPRAAGRLRLRESARPITPAERIYLLVLVDLVRGPGGAEYRIPDDLLALLPPAPPRLGALELPEAPEPAAVAEAAGAALERDLLTLMEMAQRGEVALVSGGALSKASMARLARLRNLGPLQRGITREEHWPYARFLRTLALAAGLLRADGGGGLAVTRAALEWMRRPAAGRARALLEAWAASEWDELRSLAGVRVQNPLRRDLAGARRALLRLVGQVPEGRWVPLGALSAEVRRVAPDFARPDGDYDSWRVVSDYREPLDGFGAWDRVEGAQVRAVAGVTLRWLGLADVGLEGERPASFRLTPLGRALLAGGPEPEEPPPPPLVVQPNFEVIAPPGASPYARFQLGRVAEAGERRGPTEAEAARLTRRSVQAAQERGIAGDEIVAFLEGQSGRPLPQNVAATLREWSAQHGQIRLRQATLLEADDPAVLERAARDPRVRMPEAEALAPGAWAVPPGDAPALAERLRRAGYGLAGDAAPPDARLSERDLAVIAAAVGFYAEACDMLGVEHDASGALRGRLRRMIPERMQNRAYRAGHEALEALRKRCESGSTEPTR